MRGQILNLGFGKVLNYLAIALIILNMIYVLYSFFKKKLYYENILITFAIIFMGFVVEPISVSMKFNTKYGYEFVDFIFIGIVIYVIVLSILRNNNFFMYNMSWEEFYDAIKEVLRKREIDFYYRKPTIFLGNDDAGITHIMDLFSKRVIIVKKKGLEDIINLNDFRTEILKECRLSKFSRLYYLVINIVLTVILLLNVRY